MAMPDPNGVADFFNTIGATLNSPAASDRSNVGLARTLSEADLSSATWAGDALARTIRDGPATRFFFEQGGVGGIG
jgi:hypothetical protein